MDRTALQTFKTVAELASFSRAADHLHLTQPAVSKRVRALEQSLGMPLLDRIGHTILLTEAGRAFLPRAKQILLAMEDSLRELSNLSSQVAGQLSLATSHHIGLHRLPSVLRTYTQRYPEVELDLHFMDSETACHQVIKGQIELAIVTLPLDPAPLLELIPIWEDPLALVVGKSHPLANEACIQPQTLAQYSAVLPAIGTYTRDLLERKCRQLGIRLRVGMTTNYLETIKMLVNVGLGWSLIPETMLDGSIKTLASSQLSLQRRLGIVQHPERTLGKAARAMIAACQEQRKTAVAPT